jgi:hypothetical protein
MNKEKKIKMQKEKIQQNEVSEMQSSPNLNPKSLKIMKRLQEIQRPEGFTFKRLEIKSRQKSLSPSFHPALSDNTRKITLNRTGSVFQRLYPLKISDKEVSPVYKKKSKKYTPKAEITQKYLINSGRSTICNNNTLVDEVKFEKKMSFLLDDLI